MASKNGHIKRNMEREVYDSGDNITRIFAPRSKREVTTCLASYGINLELEHNQDMDSSLNYCIEVVVREIYQYCTKRIQAKLNSSS